MCADMTNRILPCVPTKAMTNDQHNAIRKQRNRALYWCNTPKLAKELLGSRGNSTSMSNPAAVEDYFKSIFNNNSPTELDSNQLNGSRSLSPIITPQEIMATLSESLTNTRSGLDCITGTDMKRFDPRGCVLVILFNFCLAAGYMPNSSRCNKRILLQQAGKLKHNDSGLSPSSQGYEDTHISLSHTAYADDIVLFVNDRHKMQSAIEELTNNINCFGLRFRPQKYKSLCTTYSGRFRNDHIDPFVSIYNGDFKSEIKSYLTKLDSSYLSSTQKVHILNDYLLPRLTYRLGNSITTIKRLNQFVRTKYYFTTNSTVTSHVVCDQGKLNKGQCRASTVKMHVYDPTIINQRGLIDGDSQIVQLDISDATNESCRQVKQLYSPAASSALTCPSCSSEFRGKARNKDSVNLICNSHNAVKSLRFDLMLRRQCRQLKNLNRLQYILSGPIIRRTNGHAMRHSYSFPRSFQRLNQHMHISQNVSKALSIQAHSTKCKHRDDDVVRRSTQACVLQPNIGLNVQNETTLCLPDHLLCTQQPMICSPSLNTDQQCVCSDNTSQPIKHLQAVRSVRPYNAATLKHYYYICIKQPAPEQVQVASSELCRLLSNKDIDSTTSMNVKIC
ncbi:hypothetical protein GJ496_009788 [Pomphorhynchus laevis]|nr:hypothetical protein GJ496_009788 [Pomphorhynchus laevis]